MSTSPVPTSPVTAASRVERECLRAAGLVALGGVAAGVLLWAASFPGWPLAAGVILSMLVLASLMLIMGSEPPASARWCRPLGVVSALLLAVGGGVAVQHSSDAVLRARFERSRAAFEAVTTEAGPAPRDVSDQWMDFPGVCPARLGSYRISDCHAFTRGFMFLQERNAWGDDAGFAYAPYGLSSTEDGENGLPASGFTHLTGPWYAWSCRC